MRVHRVSLLAAAASVAALAAAAQPRSAYDPAQLPSVRGKVAEYSLSPRGDVDGLILQDNTEVHLPPHLGSQLVTTVAPGDAVTIHGLRARAVPMIQAMSITNDATGKTITAGQPGSPGSQDGPTGPGIPTQDQAAHGTVRTWLHGPRGELNGLLLDDGTIVRLPVPEALRLSGQFSQGKPIFVRGPGVSGPLGRLIVADRAGPDPGRLLPIAAPPPPVPPPMPPPMPPK